MNRVDPVKFYLPIEGIVVVIKLSHVVIGHGERVETSRKYANTTTEMFKNICLSAKHARKKILK
jgi:hypothetical protein